MASRALEEPEAALQAFTIALQHPDISSDVRTICRLVQVCKAWRAAVQQAAPCAADVSLGSYSTVPSLASMVVFASWLPKYSGVVRSITLEASTWAGDLDNMDTEQYCHTVACLMTMGLQLGATPAASAVEQVTVKSASRLLRPLQLLHYSSNVACSTSIIAALPAQSLTRLALRLTHTINQTSSAFAAALGQLSNLQHLELNQQYDAPIPGALLSTMTRLEHLTSLTIGPLSSEADLQLLPQQLQHLALSLQRLKPYTIKLDHLTNLEELKLLGGFQPTGGSALPTQLRALTVECSTENPAVTSLGIGSMRQLQQLTIISSVDLPEQLRVVTALPQLQKLVLEYYIREDALTAAPAWQHLPQLLSLKLEFDFIDEEEMQQLLLGVAACTSLTSLRLWLENMNGDCEVCSHLQGLTNLRELDLEHSWCDVKRRDAVHLRSLTGLTSLKLGPGFEAAVGDFCATALACELTGLQHLVFRCCGLTSDVALPAIGKLTRLQCLDLSENTGITEEGLMMLTRLTQLTCLDVTGGDDEPCQEAVDRFWGIVRARQQAG